MMARWSSTLFSCRARWLFGAAFYVLLGIAPAQAGLNQWTSNGPEGGPILSLAVDRVAPVNVYAGTNGGGVFKSPNAGTSWAAVNNGLTNRVINALAVDPSVSGTVYAATGAGVFKTTTAGTTWTEASVGLPRTPSDVPVAILSLAVDPHAPAVIYVGTTSTGVFKSVDGGASWAPVNNSFPTLLAVNALAIDPQAPLPVEELKASLQSSNEAVRRASLETLGRLGTRAAPVLPEIERAAADAQLRADETTKRMATDAARRVRPR